MQLFLYEILLYYFQEKVVPQEESCFSHASHNDSNMLNSSSICYYSIKILRYNIK